MSKFPERVLRKIKEAEKQKLTYLDLSNNQLTNLPESITELSSLARLYLSNNQLTSLPESITKLSNLTRLDLPESITKLPNLTWLYLSNNPLVIPPVEIDDGSMEEIRKYFQQLNEMRSRCNI